MSRRQRQLDELRSLCGSGAVARAIDLAFAHFADFGRDSDVVAMLLAAVGDRDDAPEMRRRLDDLTSDVQGPHLAFVDARQPPRGARGARRG